MAETSVTKRPAAGPPEAPVAAARALHDLVAAGSDEAEAARHLPRRVALAMAEAGLYRVAVPADVQGVEFDPVTQIETIEAIAFADGAAGWNLMIGIETIGLLADGLVHAPGFFDDPHAIACSSTAARGEAVPVEGGFRVSGRWQFCSGCHNATWFGGQVNIVEDGELQPGLPFHALMPMADARIIDTWHVSGLRGSGSHDVECSDVFVPEARTTRLTQERKERSPLRRVPFNVRLAYNKTGVALGIAAHCLQAFADLAQGKTPRFYSASLKHRGHAQRAIGLANGKIRSARALVMQDAAAVWAQINRGERLAREQRAEFQIACSHAVAECVAAVELLAEAAGTTANQIGSPIDRCARDIRVVRQHLTVASHHIEDGGRVLLGLDAEGPMLR